MKTLPLFFLVSFLLLSACNRSYILPDKHLPQKSAEAAPTGILAVPKSMKSDNGVMLHAGYAHEIVIKNTDGEVFDKPIRLIRQEGCQLDFIQALKPGQYFISTFTIVPHMSRYEYTGGDKPNTVNIPFEIKAGHVTVLPVNFHVLREGDFLHSVSTRVTARKLTGEVKQEFFDVMQKEKYLKDWPVIWAEGNAG